MARALCKSSIEISSKEYEARATSGPAWLARPGGTVIYSEILCNCKASTISVDQLSFGSHMGYDRRGKSAISRSTQCEAKGKRSLWGSRSLEQTGIA